MMYPLPRESPFLYPLLPFKVLFVYLGDLNNLMAGTP